MSGDSHPFLLLLCPGNSDRISISRREGFFIGSEKELAEREDWGRDKARQEETERWAACFMGEEGCYCLDPTCEAQASQVGLQCWDWSPWDLVPLYQLACFCLQRTQILT